MLMLGRWRYWYWYWWYWYLGWCWADGRAEYTQWTEKCRSLSTLNRTIDLMYLLLLLLFILNRTIDPIYLFVFLNRTIDPGSQIDSVSMFCCLLIRVNQGQVTTGCDSNHSYLSLVSPEPDTLLFLKSWKYGNLETLKSWDPEIYLLAPLNLLVLPGPESHRDPAKSGIFSFQLWFPKNKLGILVWGKN